MREVTEFPRPVREIENVFIPLADGRRLAARLWLPEDAESDPVPAVIEYMPYRKRDHLRPRDSRIHHYLAGHGYACLRVDVRGSGDSDGVLRGEWEEGELDDGVEMIEWAARQPWSSGAVGMIGKSWSGFTCLTLAARAPAPLKAIVPVCCGDDRYHQSLHWTGGAFLLEQLWWTDTMVLFNARPPDPAIVGEDWRRMWQERLDDNTPWIDTWLDHQRRDDFWRHASICEGWSAIQCPVFAVGGWADYLSRSVPRLLANLDVPCWGLIGPWGHHYPHEAMPGPAVGFLQECVRFFDRFLKDLPNGYEETPAYRVWMQDYRLPVAEHGIAPGRWVAEKGWPSPRIADRGFVLNVGRLDAEADEPAAPGRVRRAPTPFPADPRPHRAGLAVHERAGGASGRPAPRRRGVALLRERPPRRAARDPGPGPPRARLRRRPAGRPARRPPRRRAPRGPLGAGEPRGPQPHPPRRPRRAGGPRSGAADADHPRFSPTSATPSRPGTGCGSRSRPRTGRSSGPPPSR